MSQQVLNPPATVRPRSGRARIVLLVLAIVLAAAGAAALLLARRSTERPAASATLHLADGRSIGRVDFFDARPGTIIRASVRLPSGTPSMAGFHGFHLHANDDATNGNGCVSDPAGTSKRWFVSADAHLDHGGHLHGAHEGDLPSVYVAADGRGSLEFRTDRLSVSDLANRAVVMHAGPDNFGRVPVGAGPQDYAPNTAEAAKTTQQGGNSGDRIACGLIEMR
jgi:Cu-Zn family superoxide dismutase